MATAQFYAVDTLIMGGDVCGKTVVPEVEDSNGICRFNFQGQMIFYQRLPLLP